MASFLFFFSSVNFERVNLMTHLMRQCANRRSRRSLAYRLARCRRRRRRIASLHCRSTGFEPVSKLFFLFWKSYFQSVRIRFESVLEWIEGLKKVLVGLVWIRLESVQVGLEPVLKKNRLTFSRFGFGSSRVWSGLSRFGLGSSRFENGFSRFGTGLDSGRVGFESMRVGSGRFGTGLEWLF